MWRVPFSLAAAVACASIGAHFMERAIRSRDEWTVAAHTLCAGFMGMLTVVEALQVWQELGLARDG